MKLHVLIGKRKERYLGEHGLEALACMTEYDMDSNGDYLPEQERKAGASNEFQAASVVTLDVNERAIYNILFPESEPIPAVVLGGNP